MPEETSHDNQQQSTSPGWCPLCFIVGSLRQVTRQHHEFFDHLNNAQIEILQGFKLFIEQRLSALDQRKREAETEVKKASKIKLE